MLTISGYASKSVLTIGFGCRRLSIFCKAGRWCRRCIVSGVHRHSHALELQLWQVPTSTQEDQEGEEGAQSSPEAFHLAKPRIKDWKSGPRDFQLWWGWGHWRKGSAVIRRKDRDTTVWKWHWRNGQRQCSAIIEFVMMYPFESVMTTDWATGQILAENWNLFFWVSDDVSGWNLWWQLIGVLVRSWPEAKIHQVYCQVYDYSIFFPTKVTLSCRNFKSGPRFGMASQSWRCCRSWNGSCCPWLSPILAGSLRWLL